MSDRATARFRATAGDYQSFGETPQQALAALLERLPDDPVMPIAIWPYNHGDAFFTDAQQLRLEELKQRRNSLTAEEQAELDDLVAASFDATTARVRSLLAINRPASELAAT
jgi:hypothetical protein